MRGVRGEHKHPGEFRTTQNWIGGSSLADAASIPPHQDNVLDLMSDLEQFWHNQAITVPHLVRIAISHYQFETACPTATVSLRWRAGWQQHGIGRRRNRRQESAAPPRWRQDSAMRAEPRAVAAVLTVLLHLLIVLALVRVTPIARNRPPPPPAVQETTADRLHGAGERIVSVDIRPGLATRGLACAGSSYIGVGVTATPGTERIILVGDDTPASRAGLQRDDIVLNPGVWRDAHTDGALLRMVILREAPGVGRPSLRLPTGRPAQHRGMTKSQTDRYLGNEG